MNPFITFRDKDDEGNLQYYILQRDFPHFVGVVSTKPLAGNWSSAVAGHQLWVVFSGTLRGNVIPSYQNVSDQIQLCLDNMSVWFHSERVLMDEKRFKKFKIKSNDASPI